MKITSLAENTSRRENIKAEHGLSLYIETNGRKILFDMGQTDLFSENAKELCIDLAKVDIAILSHGHYDHGGGLAKFMEINKKSPIYIHEKAFEEHYNGTEKYIGLDRTIENNPRIVYTNNTFKIDDGLTLYSCNENEREFLLSGSELTRKIGEAFLPDDFNHEQYLLIEENEKRVLISGCSHKGILNIMSWFSPDVLIGGFHFSKLALDDNLIKSAKELDRFQAVYHTCHCTGTDQFEFMKKHIKNLNYLFCGESLEI